MTEYNEQQKQAVKNFYKTVNELNKNFKLYDCSKLPIIPSIINLYLAKTGTDDIDTCFTGSKISEENILKIKTMLFAGGIIFAMENKSVFNCIFPRNIITSEKEKFDLAELDVEDNKTNVM
jgi:hypothetical protein